MDISEKGIYQEVFAIGGELLKVLMMIWIPRI
jgi:hypothetical protein